MIEIEQITSDKYQFIVKTTDDQIVLTGASTPTLEATKTLIDNIKGKQISDLLFERQTNYHGKFIFQVTTKTGKIIGKSASYTSEAGLENGIKNVKILLATL